MAKDKKPANKTIALNKKVKHDYFIEQRFEAGLSLQGWEVKSLRSGRAQLKGAYVVIKGNEIWLLGAIMTPLAAVSTHVKADPTRTRKLLLNKSEINKLIGAVERKGYTLIPISLYWKKNRAKCEIALARGKKQFDKRQTIKKREFNRQKERLLKNR